MNRNDFLNMIENTNHVSQPMIREIYKLVDIFPYFQSAHLLLLKGLQNNADVKFENQLRNSAIYIADRKMLYYLMNTQPSVSPGSEEVRNESLTSLDQSSDSQQTVIESAKNSEQLISEIEKISDENRDEQQEKVTHFSGHSILISSEMENEDYAGVMLLMDEDPPLREDKVFFMDPGFSIPEYNDLLELELETNDALTSEEDNKTAKQTGSDEFSKKSISQSELIDKFILANPRIEPVRETGKQIVEDISKPFTEVEGGFVTETLAKIYINQGYYSKAIDIYEKLSLKFPEKSSYFASQIEVIKEYLKK